MTVSAQTPINRSTGNGVTTVFPYTFKIISDADIEVTVDDVVKTLNVDYTVTGAGVDAGGNVTMTTAPAAATTVIRRRNMAIVRTTDYQDQGALPAATLDADIDSAVLMVQQVNESFNRSLKIPISSTASADLPAPEAGTVFGWNATGDALISVPSSSAVATDLAITSAAESAASAAASEVSRLASGVSADESAASAAASEVSNLASGVAKVAAEAARDAAIIQAGVYVDEPTGRAAVADGVAFKVQGSGDVAAYEYRRVNAGTVSTLIASYPSISYFESTFPNAAPIGFAWSVADSAGKAAIGVQDDGTFSAQAAVVDTLTVQDITSATFTTSNSQLEDNLVHVGFVYTIDDGTGNSAIGIKDDGTVAVNTLETDTLTVSSINGLPYTSVGSRNGGRYSHQINFVNNTGQSLSEGSSPATTITSAQEYDNIGFPAHSTSPASTVSLTVANTEVSGRGESPMYGTAGHIKELILEENGIAYGLNDYQLLLCNNGYSGYSITQLNKGTAPYTAAMSQVQAGYDIAVAAGKTFTHQANTWTQGEADTALTAVQYRDYFLQLAEDYNTDSRAITGQFNDVVTICYQTGSGPRTSALGQLAASELSNKIFMACPMYQFDYFNAQHIDATNTKWLGGYYGLAYKRIVIDGVKWQPLKPIAHAISGNTIDLFFNKEGLTLDTTLVPAQVNYGFTVRDAGLATITISSVAVIGPNRVRITCASAPTAGWFVDYGLAAAVGKGAYTGGCGNLRDKQGDSIIYSAVSKPMHNWCVLFQYQL